MKILFLIFFWISVNYEIYNMFRKKYEVFGIIIDNNKGAMAIEIDILEHTREQLNIMNFVKIISC